MPLLERLVPKFWNSYFTFLAQKCSLKSAIPNGYRSCSKWNLIRWMISFMVSRSCAFLHGNSNYFIEARIDPHEYFWLLYVGRFPMLIGNYPIVPSSYVQEIRSKAIHECYHEMAEHSHPYVGVLEGIESHTRWLSKHDELVVRGKQPAL